MSETIRGNPGEHIEKFAVRLCAAAKASGAPVCGSFNDTPLEASVNASPGEVVEAFWRARAATSVKRDLMNLAQRLEQEDRAMLAKAIDHIDALESYRSVMSGHVENMQRVEQRAVLRFGK